MKLTNDRLAVARAVQERCWERWVRATDGEYESVDIAAVIASVPKPTGLGDVVGEPDPLAVETMANILRYLPESDVQAAIDAARAEEREACAVEVEAQIPYFDRVLEASTTIALRTAARVIRARSGAQAERGKE